MHKVGGWVGDYQLRNDAYGDSTVYLLSADNDRMILQYRVGCIIFVFVVEHVKLVQLTSHRYSHL